MEHYFLCATLQHLTSVPRGWFPSWRTGEWNACSVTCGGGSQVRRVECISHDSSGPRVVKDAVCAAYAEAPPSLQTCNMHKCAEYRVARWSTVSFNFQMDKMESPLAVNILCFLIIIFNVSVLCHLWFR